MLKFTTPLFVVLPRKTKADRKIIINLNNYRNWHYITSNNAKIKFKEEMQSQLEGLKLQTPISITFTLFKKTKRISDRSNVLSIIEKFWCDAMVEHGCIEDDNDNFIKASHYYSGGVDKDNPRVEVEIIEIKQIK